MNGNFADKKTVFTSARLNIPPDAAEGPGGRRRGLQVGEMNDGDPNALMTCEDHYLPRVR